MSTWKAKAQGPKLWKVPSWAQPQSRPSKPQLRSPVVALDDFLVWLQLFRGRRCPGAGPSSPKASEVASLSCRISDSEQHGEVCCALAVLLCVQLPSPAAVENPRHLGREVASPGATT